jgi:hypothetical protein
VLARLPHRRTGCICLRRGQRRQGWQAGGCSALCRVVPPAQGGPGESERGGTHGQRARGDRPGVGYGRLGGLRLRGRRRRHGHLRGEQQQMGPRVSFRHGLACRRLLPSRPLPGGAHPEARCQRRCCQRRPPDAPQRESCRAAAAPCPLHSCILGQTHAPEGCPVPPCPPTPSLYRGQQRFRAVLLSAASVQCLQPHCR